MIVGNELRKVSSNPGRDGFHFALITFGIYASYFSPSISVYIVQEFLHLTLIQQPIYIYIYIYIYTNLLSTSIHGYQEKEKKRQNLEIAIIRMTARRKRKKKFGRKKEKTNFVTPVEKKSKDMQSVSRKNKTPP